jgi:hypothetical protein
MPRVPTSRFLAVNSYAPLKVQAGLIRLLGRPILFSREVNITGAASNLTRQVAPSLTGDPVQAN